jgi:hypothetical protein
VNQKFQAYRGKPPIEYGFWVLNQSKIDSSRPSPALAVKLSVHPLQAMIFDAVAAQHNISSRSFAESFSESNHPLAVLTPLAQMSAFELVVGKKIPTASNTYNNFFIFSLLVFENISMPTKSPGAKKRLPKVIFFPMVFLRVQSRPDPY